ncbi:PREDICTED: UPF0472 protein C16orf72 homolog isoform X1 [Polistes canadensis]|uniref:UPF0472 protein C16orf72 homolog isoform X1 n=1 Tax=Polistes canadensis TaxID=91411 RepID=UPI000718E53F|nr:PREDICTED: UPF0472 protein C16orf72 homolog isoform X1 [Polistes canadensis]
MSDDRSEDDPIMDIWYSNWEQQCVEALEAEPEYENQLQNAKEIYSQQMWASFQTTASAIAQFYKDRTQNVSLWLPFQTAAGTVTSLYKDSVDSMRRCSELGIETGKQKRSKEIMNWARKKRRMIRREDLLAYLAGKPPPPRPHSHRSSPKPRMMVCGSSPSQSPTQSMVVSQTSSPGIDLDPELHTFREAISLSGGWILKKTAFLYDINHFLGSSVSRRSGKQAELSAFISNEFARHHKRPASHDVDMGSPTHKRSRFM